MLSEEEKKQRKLERQRIRRARLKSEGICLECPEPAEPGKRKCRACLDKNTDAVRRSILKNYEVGYDE